MTAPQSLDQFCSWLKVTKLSVTVQTIEWIVPAVQTVHILAIAAVVSSALALSLHSLGLAGRDRTARQVAHRFLPVIWWALPVLLGTGLVLIVAEPARALENPVFWIKMGLLLTALAVTTVHQAPVKAQETFWEASSGRRLTTKILALTSFVLWVGVIFAGRWIAYVEAL
jgi:hypothetical protein